MARLTLSEFECPTAELGEPNPHAALSLPCPVVARYEGKDVPVEHCLPYRLLDSYGRELKLKKHRTAVLESDRLKATFLLDLGGRLWSLLHKPSGRELLYVNPVIQFANFGIRNAWFSGGIEWNVGIFGHSVFTCAPVFAGRTQALSPFGPDGLRIWEYERTRGVIWQVDFWLSDESDLIYIAPRIVNPNLYDVPMYWWTCIAVPEIPDGRVLAPASHAFEPAHAMGEDTISRDLAREPDITNPQRREDPRDTYFDIPEGVRPWVAHVGPDGEGVVHVSSHKLPGRKQWVWGMGSCGRRWQDWLSPGGPPYIEIQGGLAKKQSDYVRMPARSEWSWIETFGPISGVDLSSWETGTRDVKSKLGSQKAFESWELAFGKLQTEPPAEILHEGSGWMAVESVGNTPATPFSMRKDAELDYARFALTPKNFQTKEPPSGYLQAAHWLETLRERGGWEDSLHKGVLCFAQGSRGRAREFWLDSLRAEPNGWAYRNLAILEEVEGDPSKACEYILNAHRLLPLDPHVVTDACRILHRAHEVQLLESFLNALPPGLKNIPRGRLAQAQLALWQGKTAVVKDYFNSACDLADIRESETTLSDLWRALCDADPSAGSPAKLPPEWDFRMSSSY